MEEKQPPSDNLKPNASSAEQTQSESLHSAPPLTAPLPKPFSSLPNPAAEEESALAPTDGKNCGKRIVIVLDLLGFKKDNNKLP